MQLNEQQKVHPRDKDSANALTLPARSAFAELYNVPIRNMKRKKLHNMMQVIMRTAQEHDIPFLAWVMYTSARSHLAVSPWSVIFQEPERRVRVLLERIARVPDLPWSHVSNFWIAEVDGKPAAAMSAFAVEPRTPAPLPDLELRIARQVFDYSEQRISEIRTRLFIAASGFPEDLPGAWGIENVAVLPEFRGQGLIDRLFDRVLEEGRNQGFKRAQIPCLIGNETAQRAFERNGFEVVSQKRSAAFQELFGTPGAKLLMHTL